MLESKLHQIHRFVQVHQESGHIWVGDGNGMIVFDLFNEQGNHRSSGAHYIPIAGTADDRTAPFRCHPGIGIDDMFHHGFGNPHGIDRIGCLVSGKAYYPLHTGIDGCMEHIIRTDDIGLDSLHGKEFAGRDLFQGCRMENIIHPRHGIFHRAEIPHISHIEFDFPRLFRILCLKLMAHIILFFFIPGKNPNLSNIRF